MTCRPAIRRRLCRATLGTASALLICAICGCAETSSEPGDLTSSDGGDILPSPTLVAGVQFDSVDPDPNSPSETPTTAPTETPGEPNLPAEPPAEATPLDVVAGVGLWPRTFTLEGMVEAFDTAKRAGDVGMIQVTFAWDAVRGDNAHKGYHEKYDYLLQPIPPADSALFEQAGLRKAIWLDFLASADRRYLNLDDYAGVAAFTNPQVAAAYVADCVWLAGYWEPDYFAIGTEIDEYLRVVSVAEREALLTAFRTARDQIKASHPNTKVFVYFQYENVVARDLWELIRPFALESDLAAFSTYPSLPYPVPSVSAEELGVDYYAPIGTRLRVSVPVAFVEIGHPSASSALFPAGSAAEQSLFIERFAAAAPSNTELAIWSHLYDPEYSSVYDADVADYFGSMGLLRRDTDLDSAAWGAWLDLSEDAAP